mmetsp:Transcript_4442/g.6559  ORF Transcript_4442/g.6559 Transcript_4442/m.6559 type:complete len:187 (-) Transcript_4442:2013-2573(-)
MAHLHKVIDRMIMSEANDHVFLTFGCDFSFTQAEINYFYLDKIVNYWNEIYPEVKMVYSTPARYIGEIKKINEDFKNATEQSGFAIRHDDSFPYAQNDDEYWSGYYTTRPHFKRMTKIMSQRFHSSLRMASLEVLKQSPNNQSAFVLEQQKSIMEKLGVAQHHDSITGTGVKRVAEDYFRKVQETL